MTQTTTQIKNKLFFDPQEFKNWEEMTPEQQASYTRVVSCLLSLPRDIPFENFAPLDFLDRASLQFSRILGDSSLDPKKRCEIFLYDHAIKQIFLKNFSLTPFQKLKELANIWVYPLQQERNSIQKFATFYCKELHGISEHLMNKIWGQVNDGWKKIMNPLALLSGLRLSLDDITRYFFPKNEKLFQDIHFLVSDSFSRFAVFTNPPQPPVLMLHKTDDFLISEVPAVVHELQHIVDSKDEHFSQWTTYEIEKSALQMEYACCQRLGSRQSLDNQFYHNNYFQPLLEMTYEFHSFLDDSFQEKCNVSGFSKQHGMLPQDLKCAQKAPHHFPFAWAPYVGTAMELLK